MSPPDETEDFEALLDETLADRPLVDRKPIFVALLNEHLPDGDGVVLLGGALVEILSSGAYTTGDLDLVGDGGRVRELLEEAGFESEGRHHVHPDLGLTVEIVGSHLEQDQTRTVIEYKGYKVPTVTIEDVIVDRLNAAKHWDSQTDWEQAIIVYKAHGDRLDPDRLQEKAAHNDVEDLLEELEGSWEDAG